MICRRTCPQVSSALIQRPDRLWPRLGWRLAFALLVGSAGWLAAQPSALPIPVRFQANWPGYSAGPALDVWVAGELAYVAAADAGLLVMDLQQGSNAVVIGSLRLPASGPMAATGPWVFFVSSGLQVVDVSNPVEPTPAAHFDLGLVRGLAVSGNYAYAVGEGGLTVLAAGSGTTPRIVRALPQLDEAVRIVVADGHAYVAESLAVHIFDLQDPANPRSQGTVRWESGLSALDLAINGTVAYVLDDSGLRVLDVEDPDHPRDAGYVPLPPEFQGYRPCLALSGNRLFVGSYWWLSVFDVANPLVPRDTVEAGVPLGDPGLVVGGVAGIRSMRMAGSTLILARAYDGLSGVSLAGPSGPRLLWTFSTDYEMRGVSVSGNDLYVLNYPSGLQQLSLLSGRPVLRGTFPFGSLAAERVGLIASGRFAYIASPHQGLVEIDFLDPLHPLSRSWPAAPGRWYDTASALLPLPDGFVVTGYSDESGWFTATAFTVRDPWWLTNTWQISTALDPGIATCRPLATRAQYRPGPLFYVKNQRLLRFEHDLRVYSDLGSNMTFQPNVPLGDCFDRLVANDEFVWLGGEHGVTCVDIRDLGAPTNLGSIYSEPVSGMALVGSALVVTGPEGLKIIESATHGTAAVLGFYPGGGFGEVAVAGNQACVARGRDGLLVLELGTVGLSPPRILRHPARQLVLVGSTTNFEVAVEGAVPLSYQWRLNGTDLPGATNASLILTNVTVLQSGTVQVAVRNAWGEAVSSNGFLRVNIPPEITMVTPRPGYVCLADQPVRVEAAVLDPDGFLPEVSFYTDGVRRFTGLVFFTYRIAIYVNFPPGITYLSADVTDTNGAIVRVEPFAVFATNAMVFQLTQSLYAASESNGAVTVTVRRNATAAASVRLVTQDGNARAVGVRGLGHYFPVSTNLVFTNGQTEASVAIPLVNNLIYQGSRFFRVRLQEPSESWVLMEPSEAVIQLEDDDDPSQTETWTEVEPPRPETTARGRLRVNLDPPEARGRWRFLWETRWRDPATEAAGLVPGHYPTVFLPCAGFLAPATVTNIIAPSAEESVTEHYVPIGQELGGLSLILLPGAVGQGQGTNRGQWRLLGGATEDWQDSGALLSDLPAGVHLVEFKPVAGFRTPPSQSLPVFGHQTLVRQAQYLLAPPETGAPSDPLNSFDEFANGLAAGWPLAFAGQLVSEAGLGTGFVVKRRTVLTAAHVVFDSTKLSYVDRLWWFFQQHPGEHEVVPQTPRGFYAFAGYAAARTNDLTQLGLSPGEASLGSMSQDIAVLYFYEDAGRGGYGGFLVSDGSRDWLRAPQASAHIVLSYPVQGVPPGQTGKLHRAGPGFFNFEWADEGVDYSDEIRAYPGSSGGPVCVLWTNSLGRPWFFPAAIQLGGTSRLTVRLIDQDVAELIGRSEQTANGGPITTGAGFINVALESAGASHRAGLLSVRVGPPAALRLGGAWRVSPTNYGELGELRGHTQFTGAPAVLPVVSSNFTLEVGALAGFFRPTNEAIRVIEDANVLLDLRYAVVPPQLFPEAEAGLGIVGTPGTAYRLETKLAGQSEEAWLPFEKIALEPGTNWVTAARFLQSTGRVYRAVWLSE